MRNDSSDERWVALVRRKVEGRWRVVADEGCNGWLRNEDSMILLMPLFGLMHTIKSE